MERGQFQHTSDTNNAMNVLQNTQYIRRWYQQEIQLLKECYITHYYESMQILIDDSTLCRDVLNVVSGYLDELLLHDFWKACVIIPIQSAVRAHALDFPSDEITSIPPRILPTFAYLELRDVRSYPPVHIFFNVFANVGHVMSLQGAPVLSLNGDPLWNFDRDDAAECFTHVVLAGVLDTVMDYARCYPEIAGRLLGAIRTCPELMLRNLTAEYYNNVFQHEHDHPIPFRSRDMRFMRYDILLPFVEEFLDFYIDAYDLDADEDYSMYFE